LYPLLDLSSEATSVSVAQGRGSFPAHYPSAFEGLEVP
jgi:hypothetical protein